MEGTRSLRRAERPPDLVHGSSAGAERGTRWLGEKLSSIVERWMLKKEKKRENEEGDDAEKEEREIGGEGEVDGVGEVVRDLCRALLEADVPVRRVVQFKNEMTELLRKADAKESPLQVMMKELIKMVNPQRKVEVESYGGPFVIMPMPLIGTNTLMDLQLIVNVSIRLALHFKGRQQMKVGIVLCSDRVQDMRPAIGRLRIPNYGCLTTTDPLEVARCGIKCFFEEAYDVVILVCTNDERTHLAPLLSPGAVFWVADASLGQGLSEHFDRIREHPNSSVILANMEHNRRGFAALATLASSSVPISFIFDDEEMFEGFRAYEPKAFVRRMLGPFASLPQAFPPTDLHELRFTLRDLHKLYCNHLKVWSYLPQGTGDQNRNRRLMERQCTILESMTAEELDHPELFDARGHSQSSSRIDRIAYGCGCSRHDVMELLRIYRSFFHVGTRCRFPQPHTALKPSRQA